MWLRLRSKLADWSIVVVFGIYLGWMAAKGIAQ